MSSQSALFLAASYFFKYFNKIEQYKQNDLLISFPLSSYEQTHYFGKFKLSIKFFDIYVDKSLHSLSQSARVVPVFKRGAIHDYSATFVQYL